MMRVRCNGPENHINEVFIDDILKPKAVYRSGSSTPPERTVLNCTRCDSQVIISREMIEQYQEYLKNRS